MTVDDNKALVQQVLHGGVRGRQPGRHRVPDDGRLRRQLARFLRRQGETVYASTSPSCRQPSANTGSRFRIRSPTRTTSFCSGRCTERITATSWGSPPPRSRSTRASSAWYGCAMAGSPNTGDIPMCGAPSCSSAPPRPCRCPNRSHALTTERAVDGPEVVDGRRSGGSGSPSSGTPMGPRCCGVTAARAAGSSHSGSTIPPPAPACGSSASIARATACPIRSPAGPSETAWPT